MVTEEISAGKSEARPSGLDDLIQQGARQPASMEKLHATVEQTNGSALRSQAAVQNTLHASNAGRSVVKQMMASMDEIDQSSNQIAGIASLIEGIAFQTNILSLNAAVEAARAGDEGRGFSVVASEARSLAHRSSTASKEIAKLIASSNVGVEKGTRYAREAGEAMAQIE